MKDNGSTVGRNGTTSNSDSECILLRGRVTSMSPYSSNDSNIDFADASTVITTSSFIDSMNNNSTERGQNKLISGGGSRSMVVVGTDEGLLHYLQVDLIS